MRSIPPDAPWNKSSGYCFQYPVVSKRSTIQEGFRMGTNNFLGQFGQNVALEFL